MIYLLGGPPRVGKSIISKEIGNKHAISVVSTDSLGAVLESVLSVEAAPDLFVFARFSDMPLADRVKLMVDHPNELVDYLIKESRVVWKAVEAFVGREKNEGRDVLVEGVAVLPELVSQLEIAHRTVFIGNQGDRHDANMKRFARENQHDWLRSASDQYVRAFATFVKRMSACIEQEAQKYGYPYIEMDGEAFWRMAGTIANSLGLRSR